MNAESVAALNMPDGNISVRFQVCECPRDMTPLESQEAVKDPAARDVQRASVTD